MERLVLSHPIWFLPGIQRAGAFHLLQGKEEGCFVVRKSSQSDTMALSVRLPPDKGTIFLTTQADNRLKMHRDCELVLIKDGDCFDTKNKKKEQKIFFRKKAGFCRV